MTRPLWVDPEEQGYPRLEANIDVDVAIAGGGLSGLGAAYGLCDLGHRVALLEARTVASGASGRNAGFIVAGPAADYVTSSEAIGPDETRVVWEFSRENHRLIAQLVNEHNIEYGYLRRGTMRLAVDEAEMARVHTVHARLQCAELASCLLDAGDLPVPFDRMYVGGIYHPGNGEIDPGRFVRGLGRVLSRSMSIFERTQVQEMRRDGGGWIVQTNAGSVRARAVILATNAYTRHVLPNVPIRPVRGQVVATGPLDRVVVPVPMGANSGYQYWRQTAEGRLVVGGWRNLEPEAEVGTEEIVNQRIQSALDEFSAVVAGPTSVIEHRWAGIMGFTPDMLPLVGPVPGAEDLYMAAGYSGHGVAMALLCGRRVARLAAGEEVHVPACFNPARWLTGVDV